MSAAWGLIGLLVAAIPVVVVVVVVVAATRRKPGQPLVPGVSIRRFFQYLLAFGLVVTVAVGASITAVYLAEGLRPSGRRDLVEGATTAIVGGLLLAGVAWWIARDLRRPEERRAAGWRWYLAVTNLVAMAVTAVATGLALDAALAGRFDAAPAAVAGVWAVVWLVHRWLEHATVPPAERAVHLFLGSLAGLGAMATGIVLTLGALGRVAFTSGALFVGGGSQLTGGLAVLVVGVAVWAGHWLLGYRHAERRPAWLVLVLPVGVGGGTVLAVVGASRALYQVLVWFVGAPVESTAAQHFTATPTALAAAVTGIGLVAYHRAVLGGGAVTAEVARVHRYLVSGLALGAAAVGLGLVISAGLGGLGPTPLVGSDRNALLAALTLLGVAGPLWWYYWRGIARALAEDPVPETESPSRRIYLVVLFGLLAVVAAGAIIVAAVAFVRELVEGSSATTAVHAVRGALGVIVAAGTVAWYHGVVFRADRARLAAAAPAPGVLAAARFTRVVLVGPQDDTVTAAVRSTGPEVETWVSDATGPWGAEAVLAALAPLPGGVAVVISEPDGPRARLVVPMA